MAHIRFITVFGSVCTQPEAKEKGNCLLCGGKYIKVSHLLLLLLLCALPPLVTKKEAKKEVAEAKVVQSIFLLRAYFWQIRGQEKKSFKSFGCGQLLKYPPSSSVPKVLDENVQLCLLLLSPMRID